MNIPLILFYLFALVAAVAATGILLIRNVFYGALMLLVCLLAVAAIYVLMLAEFVAVTQLLIYAGGVLVVILFGIMLTLKISGKPLIVKNSKWVPGFATGLSFLIVLVYFFAQEISAETTTHKPDTAYDNIQRVGIGLMSDFVVPFEVAGVLLLIALVGAAVMASYNQKNA